jgi:hypothetical protein
MGQAVMMGATACAAEVESGRHERELRSGMATMRVNGTAGPGRGQPERR